MRSFSAVAGVLLAGMCLSLSASAFLPARLAGARAVRARASQEESALMKRLVGLLCLGLAACGGGGGGNTPLTIAPTQVSLDPGMAKTFSGAGGSKPYSFSIASGGGSIDGTSGAYTAPASAGSTV